jgi:hypothetical protein
MFVTSFASQAKSIVTVESGWIDWYRETSALTKNHVNGAAVIRTRFRSIRVVGTDNYVIKGRPPLISPAIATDWPGDLHGLHL